jgi:hypothetical protein
MTFTRAAAVVVAALSLAAPSAASGHAWSDTRALSSDGSFPVSDVAMSGHAIAGWRASADAKPEVAVGAPGGTLAVTSDQPPTMGYGVHDVAIAENGDAFAAWMDNTTLRVATRRAGETWMAGQQLVGVSQNASWDLAAGPNGDAVVVAAGSSGELLTFRRDAGDATFAAGPSGPGALSSITAGYVGDVVVIAGEAGSDVYGRRLSGDTLSAATLVDETTGPPEGLDLRTHRGGAGAVLTWPAFGDVDGNGTSDGHMRVARAGGDGVLGAGAAASGALYKGVMKPTGAIAGDGRTLVGWGDAEFDPVSIIAAPSVSAPFAATSTPAVPGNRTDELRLGIDAAGAQLAAWYFQDNASGGSGATRIEVATRLAGAAGWCGAETLATHRANAYTLSLRLDGQGRGFALWMTPAAGPGGTGSIWTSQYAARTDCPPTPPPPPAEQVQREEVVYLPPPPPPPTVVITRRVVQLALPKRASADAKGRVRIPVECKGDGTCIGRLALKRGRAVWASRSFSIAPGKRTLRVTLRKAARRALARKRRTSVSLELRLSGQALKRSQLTLARR